MTDNLSLIGPDMFMDRVGKIYKKAEDDNYERIQDKYTEAEDRYVAKELEKKGRENI